MAERPVILEGRNGALLAFQLLCWIGAGLVLLGPGRIALGEARSDVAMQTERESEWAADYGDAEELTAEERKAWAADFEAIRTLGARGRQEPDLTAWVANELRAPSVAGLEVVADSTLENEPEPSYVVRSPEDQAPLGVHDLRVRVRFDAEFGDLSDLLERIESEGSAMALRALHLRRNGTRVQVEMQIEIWAQVAQGEAGS